jgi:hypothetical protein
MPPEIKGFRVFTLPPKISGNLVMADIFLTPIPPFLRAFAVPPVATI